MNCRRSNLTTITVTTGREKCSVPGFVHVSKLWKLLEREKQLNNLLRDKIFNVQCHSHLSHITLLHLCSLISDCFVT